MPFNIAPVLSPDYGPGTQLLASAFPGITQDGRVIYGATLKLCSKDKDTGKPCQDVPGYVTSDPYQSNAYQAYLQQHKGPARRDKPRVNPSSDRVFLTAESGGLSEGQREQARERRQAQRGPGKDHGPDLGSDQRPAAQLPASFQ